jgi:hypothetical protein
MPEEQSMTTRQGDLALLQDPIAQELLTGQTILRLAYTWTDGTPRVVPHWFLWNGREVILGTSPDAPKVRVLRQNPRVALTIDTLDFPHKVLLLRGTAAVEMVDGVAPEYAQIARKAFGEEQGAAWVEQIGGLFSQMARVRITPDWAAIQDFQTRFPSAVERAMARAQADAN